MKEWDSMSKVANKMKYDRAEKNIIGGENFT